MTRFRASFRKPGIFTLYGAVAVFVGCAGKSTTIDGDNEGGADNGARRGLSGGAGLGASGGRGGSAGSAGFNGGRSGSAGTTGGGRGGTGGTAGAGGGPGGSAGAPDAGRGGFGGGGSGPIAGTGPSAGASGTAGTGMHPCNPSPCENGASCTVVNGRYACECPPGFEGLRCELNTNECLSMPCLNGGTCVDTINAYQCKCLAGFEGPDCGVNHDDCSPNPCENGGSCSDEVNGFTCACAAGWQGPRCEVPITACSDEKVCQHGGTCQLSEDDYRCVCDRYTGTHCETPKVLLIHDGTPDLVATILRNDGMDVTVAEVETEYDANPIPPGEFCAVVHLNGVTYSAPMPYQGQIALRDYVVGTGGGFVGTAWNGYEAATMSSMSELILVPYLSGHEGLQTYQLTSAGASHPVTAGLPAAFSFSGGFSEGRCPSTSTVLATEANYQDAVCVADVGAGRVVDFNHAGFYQYSTQYRTWEDPNVQRLLVQGVNWACRR